jgi:hypothetical protein
MGFEGPNSSFCRVASMEAGREKLKIDVFFLHVLLKDLRGFVV